MKTCEILKSKTATRNALGAVNDVAFILPAGASPSQAAIFPAGFYFREAV